VNLSYFYNFLRYVIVFKSYKRSAALEDDDSIFLQAIRGCSENGTIYGQGTTVGLFYEKPVNNSTANKPSYTSSNILLFQIEVGSTRTELNSMIN